jgi:hypothetical protein
MSANCPASKSLAMVSGRSLQIVRVITISFSAGLGTAPDFGIERVLSHAGLRRTMLIIDRLGDRLAGELDPVLTAAQRAFEVDALLAAANLDRNLQGSENALYAAANLIELRLRPPDLEAPR